jgi:hypothetical protein
VAMRPGARRSETARKARKRPGQAFGQRLGTGQKPVGPPPAEPAR